MADDFSFEAALTEEISEDAPKEDIEAEPGEGQPEPVIEGEGDTESEFSEVEPADLEAFEESAPDVVESDDPYADILGDDEPVKAEVNTALVSENEGLKTQVSDLQMQLMQSLNLNPPDRDLLNPNSDKYDPDEYNAQSHAYLEAEDRVRSLQAQAQHRADEAILEFKKARDAELREAMPHLYDESRGPKIWARMKQEAVGAGITEQQFDLLPAKVVGLLDDALRYRAGQQKLTKARQAKPASKIVRKSARQGPNKAKQAAERLAKIGTTDAFSAALLADTEN